MTVIKCKCTTQEMQRSFILEIQQTESSVAQWHGSSKLGSGTYDGTRELVRKPIRYVPLELCGPFMGSVPAQSPKHMHK